MYEGNMAELQMERVLCADEEFDELHHRCKVYQYDIEDDFILLQFLEPDLKRISLDAVYRLLIHTRNETLQVSGRVTERYMNQNGNILCLKIDCGFFVN